MQRIYLKKPEELTKKDWRKLAKINNPKAIFEALFAGVAENRSWPIVGSYGDVIRLTKDLFIPSSWVAEDPEKQEN